jgi:hypothetical protein
VRSPPIEASGAAIGLVVGSEAALWPHVAGRDRRDGAEAGERKTHDQ